MEAELNKVDANFTMECEITDFDVDNPYHHVHHAQSIRLFETARCRYMEHIGFPQDWFFSNHLYLVVSAIHVQYKREVMKGIIHVTCENPQVQGKFFVLTQRLFNQKDKEAVVGEVEVACLSGITKRAVEPPKEFMDVLLGNIAKKA